MTWLLIIGIVWTALGAAVSIPVARLLRRAAEEQLRLGPAGQDPGHGRGRAPAA